MEHHTPKRLCCVDCDTEFVFTEGEQADHIRRGLEHEPRRCQPCRRRRRAIGLGHEPPERAGRIGLILLHEYPCEACGRIELVPFQPDGAVRRVWCQGCLERLLREANR